jgi:hypothetical protein
MENDNQVEKIKDEVDAQGGASRPLLPWSCLPVVPLGPQESQ